MNSKIIILSGPTATGKTDLAIKLSKKYNLAMINFDSLCFYQELLIGSARPLNSELSGIDHYLFGTESIFFPLNAADFCKKATQIIKNLGEHQQNIILVGGSGFYLNTLIHGMYDSIPTPPEIVKKSDELYKQSGINEFINILKEVDQISFTKLHPNDHYRIRRAVEHYWATNQPFSLAHAKMEKNRGIVSEFSNIHLHLDLPKDIHRKIILNRVYKMIENGLIDEVTNLLKLPHVTGHEKPLNSIGYKEIQLLLKNQFKNQSECIDRIAIETHQLAKAQRTWFQKIVDKKTFNPLTDEALILKEVENLIKK